MATKEQITISNPAVALDNSPYSGIAEKRREKEERQLRNLGVVLRLLEEEIVEAKTSGAGLGAKAADGEKIVDLNTGQTNNSSKGPSNSAYENAMAEMVLMLQMLQGKIAKFSENQAENDAKISQGLVDAAQANLKAVEDRIKKIQKEMRKEKHASFWEKIGEAVLGTLTVAIGTLLAQPEIVVMGVLSLASSTGVFEQIAKHVLVPILTAGGSHNKLGEKGADIIADIFVCAVVILAAASVGDYEQAIEEGAEAGVAVSEDAVNVGMESFEIEEDVAQTTFQQTWQAIKDSPAGQVVSAILKAAARFNKLLGASGRTAMFAAITTTQSTQLVNKIVDAIMEGCHVPEAKRKEIETDLNYALMALTFVASLAVMGGASSSSSSSLIGAGLGKVVSVGQKVAYDIGQAGIASANIYSGIIMTIQGHLEKDLGVDSGKLEFVNAQLEVVNNKIKQDQAFEADTLQTQNVGNRSAVNLAKGEAAFANLFTQHSPV